MRLLLKSNDGSLEVVEIIDIGFDDDILCMEDEDGKRDKKNGEPIIGLYFIDTDKEWWYFPGISMEVCNEVCQRIFETGIADLRTYGDYYDLDEIRELYEGVIKQ